MKTVSYAAFIENPDQTVEKAWAEREGILVTREEGRSFVVRSLEPDEMDATEYLMSNPKNAERLRESIRQAESGQVVYKTMEELEEMAG